MKSVHFKDWVTGWHWGVRIALFLLLLSALSQLGMFVLTQNYMVGYLGAQPEDISFAVMCTYAGIITVIPLQFRFFRYFQAQTYLLGSLIAAVVLNGLCIYCRDINLFLLIRFFQGVLTGNVLVFTLLLIFTRLPSERVKIIAPAVFYGTILSNTVVIGLVAGLVVESSDWKVSYYYLIFFQLLMIIVVLLMLKRTSAGKRYPLYQIDWSGMIIFACTALSLGYTIIYGSKYYWFSDGRIIYGTIATIAGGGMFLYRQHILKRPVIALKVFRSRSFLIGVSLLAIYYGSKDSINLIYNYATGVLKWTTLEVMELGLCNVLGMVGLLIVSIRLLLAQRVKLKILFICGFALMGSVNIWMSFFLTPDLSFSDIIFPVLLQGAASGLLFVPLMIFVLSSAPADTGSTGLLVAACTRFTATLNSFAGFYNLQLYFNQKFREGFLGYLTPENQNMAERLTFYRGLYASKGFSSEQASALANSAIWQNLNQQAQLLTNRAVFMVFGVVLLSISVVLVFIPAIGKSCTWGKTRINISRLKGKSATDLSFQKI
ncbi:DHA2 family multidrug resistance protein [Pedobacter sp. W3I1]|uniref:MFS transporter n=1 Tax=Pedobacter sp. W3I1 TaxID=3042291 RepID=UPI0027841D50|nr:MFS transporter [Pedobacter sp. W3I1]MDQ0640289.1 DHA2 family multidrug resistance protein [Pedobacter sp. W3I1]